MPPLIDDTPISLRRFAPFTRYALILIFYAALMYNRPPARCRQNNSAQLRQAA